MNSNRCILNAISIKGFIFSFSIFFSRCFATLIQIFTRVERDRDCFVGTDTPVAFHKPGYFCSSICPWCRCMSSIHYLLSYRQKTKKLRFINVSILPIQIASAFGKCIIFCWRNIRTALYRFVTKQWTNCPLGIHTHTHSRSDIYRSSVFITGDFNNITSHLPCTAL